MQTAMTLSDPILIGIAVVLSLAFSTIQSLISSRIGTDQPVHLFIINNIRKGGFRLFVRIPRLLNTCYCAAVPLYLHWVLAHFGVRQLLRAERLLNPVMNALHVSVFGVLACVSAREAGFSSGIAGLMTLIFAMTPQFFHALSARNFGISARGIGMLLLTLFFSAAIGVEMKLHPPLAWAALVIASWLIWGFSTFAQQALCLVCVALALISGRWVPLAGMLFGLALFVAIHARYSLGYLHHTLRFIRSYALELAPIYVLAKRYSIWRDLVSDIWKRFGTGVPQALRYAYENSFVVVVLLNPFVPLAVMIWLRPATPLVGLAGYAAAVATAGALTVLATSFRATRFLGEPERYAEIVAPWAVLAGAGWLAGRSGDMPLAWIASAFVVANVFQLFASRTLVRFVGRRREHMTEVAAAIRARLGDEVRFCSNNEQLTKQLMGNDWLFAYCLAVGQDYCGMTLQQAFSSFPMLRRTACQKIVTSYRVNACLLDRSEYETLFDDLPAGLRSVSVAYESPTLRLLVLDWSDGSVPNGVGRLAGDDTGPAMHDTLQIAQSGRSG